MQTAPENGVQNASKVRAAPYVRMSTEHQKYSTENQRDVIREYAQRRGFEIVQTYAAKICETRLLFVVTALKSLLQEEHFVTLLRAEGLDSLPQYIAEQINGEAS